MTKPAIWITFVSCANELYDKEEKEGKEAIMISIPTKTVLSST